MKRVLLFLCVALAGAALPAMAKEAPPAAADPALEGRTLRLAEELRCLVCQNQTIADSNAELAVDLRQQIREQIRAGKTNEQIMDYMVQRYGDFVLYRPPFKATTILLWAGPFVLLGLALAVLVQVLRARRREPGQGELSTEERARAAALLARDGDKS